MKKIGIITVQKAPNYGAMLQCYALQKYIQKLGHKCEVIDLCRPYHNEYKKTIGFRPYVEGEDLITRIHFIYKRIKSRLGLYLSSNGRKFNQQKKRFEKEFQNELRLKEQKFVSFNNRIIYSQKYRSIGELYDNPPIYDIYITGSDQLWNPSQPYCIEPFFLTFAPKESVKMSYATSIGITELSARVKDDYRRWLGKYDYISLREDTAINLLQPLVSDKIVRTIDPTFLITPDEWSELAEEPQYSDYIFCFTLSNNEVLLDYAKRVSKKYGKKLIYWSHNYQDKPGSIADALGIIDISPEQWLGFIKHSFCVITDSFHGSVFSILFHKIFMTYISKENNRGSRIIDLLEMLNLEDRLIQNISNSVIDTSIDYLSVDQAISTEILKSKQYLSKIDN